MRLSFQFPFTQSQTVGVLSCPIASLAVRFTEAAVEEPNVGRKALVPPEPHSHIAATFESVCRGIETLLVSFAGYLKIHTEEEPSLPLCRGFMLVRYAVCLLNQLRNRYSCFHKP